MFGADVWGTCRAPEVPFGVLVSTGARVVLGGWFWGGDWLVVQALG